MTHRLRRLLGLGYVVAVAGGCSSTSGTPLAADSGVTPVEDAPASMMCDAVSLAAPAEAGAAACFACQAMKCMSEMATCSTDCTCAPAFACLEQNSTGDSLNSGYSACPMTVEAIMNGNEALMGLAGCAATNCSAECFGSGGGDAGAGDGG